MFPLELTSVFLLSEIKQEKEKKKKKNVAAFCCFILLKKKTMAIKRKRKQKKKIKSSPHGSINKRHKIASLSTKQQSAVKIINAEMSKYRFFFFVSYVIKEVVADCGKSCDAQELGTIGVLNREKEKKNKIKT